MDSNKSFFGLIMVAWMWDENGLGLTGSDLTVYAAIYGAACDERHVMASSCADLAAALGISKRSVITAINRLEDRGLIIQFLSRPSGNGGRHIRGFTVDLDVVRKAQENASKGWPDQYRYTVPKLKLRSAKPAEPHGGKRRVYPFDERVKAPSTSGARETACASTAVARPR